MAINVFVKPLLGVELFHGLRPLQITEIARRADRIVYKPGDVILQRDAPGDAAVLVLAGEAIRVSGPLDVQHHDEPLPVGSLLGEMAMLIETDYSSTIIAQTSVRALRINRSELHAQMAEDQALADHLVQCIATRLNKIARALRDIDDRMALPSNAFVSTYGLETAAALAGIPGQPALH